MNWKKLMSFITTFLTLRFTFTVEHSLTVSSIKCSDLIFWQTITKLPYKRRAACVKFLGTVSTIASSPIWESPRIITRLRTCHLQGVCNGDFGVIISSENIVKKDIFLYTSLRFIISFVLACTSSSIHALLTHSSRGELTTTWTMWIVNT